MGENSLPDYGSVVSVNRPVRTRMPGGVGAGGEKPPATRLGYSHRLISIPGLAHITYEIVLLNSSFKCVP
jgi:hypothetical protein